MLALVLTMATVCLVAWAAGPRRSLTMARLLSVSEAKWMLQRVAAAAFMPGWTSQLERAKTPSVQNFARFPGVSANATADGTAAADAYAQAPAPGLPAFAGAPAVQRGPIAVKTPVHVPSGRSNHTRAPLNAAGDIRPSASSSRTDGDPGRPPHPPQSMALSLQCPSLWHGGGMYP